MTLPTRPVAVGFSTVELGPVLVEQRHLAAVATTFSPLIMLYMFCYHLFIYSSYHIFVLSSHSKPSSAGLIRLPSSPFYVLCALFPRP